MGIMSGNHDWNLDGKVDWQDDALFHEEIYKNGGSSGGSGGDNGGCAGCLSSIIAGILVFIVLAMLFGH